MWRDSHGISMGFSALRSILKNPSPRFWWQAVERPRPKEPKHRGLYPKGGVVPEIGSTVRHGGHGGNREGNLPKIPEIPLALRDQLTNRRLEWLDSEWRFVFSIEHGEKFQQQYVRCTIFPITSLVPVEKAGIFERFHDPIGWRISLTFSHFGHMSSSQKQKPVRDIPWVILVG